MWGPTIFGLVCYNISSHMGARKGAIEQGRPMSITARITPGLIAEPTAHRLGMALSGLCLVHCLLLPVLAASMPLVVLAFVPADWLETEWLHAALIAPIVMVSGPVLWRGGGMRLGVLLAALAALVTGLFVVSEALETALTVAGAGTLLIAHWSGMRR